MFDGFHSLSNQKYRLGQYGNTASILCYWRWFDYEKWDICSAACVKGAQEKLPVYKFLKEPLTRKYGEQFYATLEFAFRDEE